MTIDAYAAGARRRALRGASGAVALWFIAALPRVARADAYTDFFRAVGLDDLRTVRDLLSRGFDPNTPDERGQQPLYLALRAESDKVAQLRQILCVAIVPHGGIVEIAQDQLSRLWFAIDEQGDGLVQKRLCKGRVVLQARCHGLFEISGQRHVHFP